MQIHNNTSLEEIIIISQEKRNINTELLEEETFDKIENQIDNNSELFEEETDKNIEFRNSISS